MGPWAPELQRCLGCSADQVLQEPALPPGVACWPLNKQGPRPSTLAGVGRLRSWDARPASPAHSWNAGRALPCVQSQGWPRTQAPVVPGCLAGQGPSVFTGTQREPGDEIGPGRAQPLSTCRQDRSPLSSGQFNRRGGSPGGPLPSPNTTAGN